MDSPSRVKRRSAQKSTQVAVFRRDGWICFWCKRPVVFSPAFRLLELKVKSEKDVPMAYYHPHWTRKDAPLLDELGAVVDHKVALAKGGEDIEENMCTSCNKCNGRKNSAHLEDWDKRLKSKQVKGIYGEPIHWDGLTSIFLVFANAYEDQLTSTEREWYSALR